MTFDGLSIKNTIIGKEEDKLKIIIKPRLKQLIKTMNCHVYCLFFWNHQIHAYECLISDCMTSRCPEPYCIDAKEFIFEKNILPLEVSDIRHYESVEKIGGIDKDFDEYIRRCNFKGFYYVPIISKQKVNKKKQKIGELFLLYLEKKGEIDLITAQDQIDYLVLILKNYFSNIRIYRKTQQIGHTMTMARDIARTSRPYELYELIAKKGIEKYKEIYGNEPGIVLRVMEGDNLKVVYNSPDVSCIPSSLSKDDSIFIPVFKNKKPLIINHTDSSSELKDFLKKYSKKYPAYVNWIKENVKSLMHIPIIIGKPEIIGNVIQGILSIHHKDANAFGKSEERYFNDLSILSSIALMKVQQLEEIYRLIIEIITKDKKDELLPAILDAGLKLVNAKSGNIRFVNREKNILFRLAESADPTLDGDVEIIKIGEGICGKVARDGKSQNVRDAFEDPDWVNLQIKNCGINPIDDPHGNRLSKLTGRVRKGWMRAEIAVPLMVDNITLGVMDAHHERPGYFNDDALMLFENIAGLAALVLRKSKLADQVNTIKDITKYYQQVGGLELKPFLNDVLKKTLEVLEVEKGAIAITERKFAESKLKFIAISEIENLKQDSYRRLNDGLMGKVAIDHKLKRVDTFSNVQGHIVVDKDIKSELISPLIFDNKLQGIVMVASTKEDRFTEDDELIISTIANLVAVLVHNIKLLKEKEDYSRKIIEETIHSMMLQTSMLAHQVKNPLMAIQVSAGNLNQIVKSEQENIKRYSNIIMKHINEASKTIQSMLNFSQKASKSITGDIHYVLDETLNFIKDLKRKQKINIVRYYDSCICQFDFDKFQIQQSFSNIILNAFEAMESKGDRLEVKTIRNNDSVQISFIDNGVGMDQETRKNIFEPLYTTKPKKKGTGLGLSLCKEYIKSNKGWIKVESIKGEGSTFSIILPYKVKEA